MSSNVRRARQVVFVRRYVRTQVKQWHKQNSVIESTDQTLKKVTRLGPYNTNVIDAIKIAKII